MDRLYLITFVTSKHSSDRFVVKANNREEASSLAIQFLRGIDIYKSENDLTVRLLSYENVIDRDNIGKLTESFYGS